MGALRLSSTSKALRNLRDYCLAYKKVTWWIVFKTSIELTSNNLTNFWNLVWNRLNVLTLNPQPVDLFFVAKLRKVNDMHVARKLIRTDGILKDDTLRELCGELGFPPKQLKKVRLA